MNRRQYDIVIIGAGVIGHSIAFRLKRRAADLRLAVLGDPMNSLMASRAAAGMLAPFGEHDRDDRIFRFCRESLDKYPQFVEEVTAVGGVGIYLSMAGSIMPHCLTKDRWDDRLKFFRDTRIPHEVWPADVVKKKMPYLSDQCGAAIWVGEGQVNNRQLHDALTAASGKLGIDIINRNVTGFTRDASSIGEALTGGGEPVRGKKFVLAGGSWSTQLAKGLGVTLPLKPIKGQMCRLLVKDNRLDYTVHGFLTYIAPWRGGHGFVLGSTMEDRGFDPRVEEGAIRALIENAAAVLPCLREAPLAETWTGLRPAAEDHMPVMGKSARFDNLYYSTGHFRNGILQTPNQADYMADTVLETLAEEIREFSPARYNL
ncbi:MAG: NAD(P)/FAD-dependent oxidoreductase [Nitrospinales bacterium]